MLSLETCKALAEKYPEMREHTPVSGDVYYFDREAVVVKNVRALAVPFDVWCPRLGDLLEIAARLVASGHPPYARLEYDPSAKTWYFGPAQYGSIDNAAEGESPEGAVAAWLLARSVNT